MTPARRYPTLDLLRVIAITMTMLTHTPSLNERIFFLRPFREGTWLGVDLFMLISGWLLGGQLLRESREGPLDPKRFYLKRWMRTLPPYYALLLLFYFAHWSSPGASFGDLGVWQYLSHFVFLQVYLDTNRYMVSWSLCVEEHFYLLLPLIVWLLGRRARLQRLAAIIVVAELVALYCRWVTAGASPDVPYETHMRAHGLFIGLLLAFISQERPEWWQWLGRYTWLIGPLGIVASLGLFASIPYVTPLQSQLLWKRIACPTLGTWALALCFIPCVHENSRWSRVSFWGLQYMGELTFAIYLVHDAIPAAWLGEKIGSAGSVAVARRVAIVLGCSMIVHHLVEEPFLRLRARVLARDTRLRASASVASPGPSS